MLHFDCEKCGKPFHVDDQFAGKKGRCRWCGQIMRIPENPHPLPEPSHAADSTTPFRLSPAEERPWVGPRPPIHHDASHDQPNPLASTPAASHPHHHPHHDFELVDDDDESPSLASPEAIRGLRAIEEFQKNPHGYRIAGQRPSLNWRGWFTRDSSRPASWIRVKWRGFVSSILRILRFIDAWAYLISVPFLILMLFAIVLSNRGLAHIGAVVVVLVNFGRFWTDLAALYVRPFKDGLLQGLAFLFPPYSMYYMFAHWDRVRSPLRRIATSCIPIVLVLLAYAFLPTVNPKVAQLPDIPSKLHSAERELIKDVESDLKKVGVPESVRDAKPRGEDSLRP